MTRKHPQNSKRKNMQAKTSYSNKSSIWLNLSSSVRPNRRMILHHLRHQLFRIPGSFPCHRKTKVRLLLHQTIPEQPIHQKTLPQNQGMTPLDRQCPKRLAQNNHYHPIATTLTTEMTPVHNPSSSTASSLLSRLISPFYQLCSGPSFGLAILNCAGESSSF